MLIEQAFHNLPEILLGSGYANQEYQQGFEASIVAALSLAVLQELNGRNANNPISYLMAEKRYFDESVNIRADLHVDLSRLFTGSADYANFGFRFNNWIEAKFFRTSKGTPPSTQNLGGIVADLFRLVCLIPAEEAKGKTRTGRYFLHVYDGDPFERGHICGTRKDGSKREWLAPLVKPGSQSISVLDLGKEKKSFYKHLPDSFNHAELELKITNFVLSSIVENAHTYVLILTRIDSGKFTWAGNTMEFTSDRTLTCSKDFNEFRKEVHEALKPRRERKKRQTKVATPTQVSVP